jgi:hypothetical protein
MTNLMIFNQWINLSWAWFFPSIYMLQGSRIEASVRVRVTLQMTVSQSVSWCRYPPDICYCKTITVLSLGPAPSLTRGRVCLVSVSVNNLVGCQFIQLYTFYMLYMLCYKMNTIYTRPLSVWTRYSRLCPISSSFRYHGSLRHFNGRMLDRREV